MVGASQVVEVSRAKLSLDLGERASEPGEFASGSSPIDFGIAAILFGTCSIGRCYGPIGVCLSDKLFQLPDERRLGGIQSLSKRCGPSIARPTSLVAGATRLLAPAGTGYLLRDGFVRRSLVASPRRLAVHVQLGRRLFPQGRLGGIRRLGGIANARG